MWVRSWTAWALSCGALVVAGCGDREETEAKHVVQRVDAIDPDAALEKRRSQVDSLRQLELQTQRAREARDLCARAHEALIVAEKSQSKAERALDEAARGDRDDAKLPENEAAAISDEIRRSDDALREAGKLLPRCQDDISALRKVARGQSS